MNADGRWTVEVDRSVCVGNRMCVATAPEVFALVDGKARPRTERVAAGAELVDAYESCPVSAIVLRGETGEQIDPEA
ncbi:ferredoxin [Actinomadura sp. 9N407]|uniref:ferredoxin n=1 Tax=Actinomadura sp. 9N407 TaxID=3375154 RepID=UPI0037AA16EB